MKELKNIPFLDVIKNVGKRINLEKGSNLYIPVQLPYKLRNVYR